MFRQHVQGILAKWLFNTKSIFMKIVLFQTIQFSISTQFVKNVFISSYSV